MQDVVPKILQLDGYLFIDRFDAGEAAVRSEATERYSSLSEAQSWINTILIDEFISEVVGDDWDVGDPLVSNLLRIYETAWSFQIKYLFPDVEFYIEKVLDSDCGDVGLRLISKPQSDQQ